MTTPGIDDFGFRVPGAGPLHHRIERAARILAEAKLVPATPQGRFISLCAAAHELGQHFPIAPYVAAIWEAELTEHGRSGGDVDWWLEARRHSMTIDAQQRGDRCSCGAMLSASPRPRQEAA